MSSRPLITVMIATRDRSSELRLTLELLRQQNYGHIEMVVIDDGSKEPIEPMVRDLWPQAIVIRHDESLGQCQRRNEGFSRAKGKFILQLDDDCCFKRSGYLENAVG